MKQIAKVIFSILLLFSFPLHGYCQEKGEAPVSEPRVLKIGYMANSFAEVDVKDAMAALQVWGDVILSNMEEKFTAEQRIFYDIQELVDAVKNNRADMVGISTLEYFKVKREMPLEVTMASVTGGKVEQEFVLLVRKDKKIKKLSQLRGKKLIVETGGRGDIGLLWLDTLFLKGGLPECSKVFRSIERAGKASQAVLPVFFGQADACIVTRGAFDTTTELNPQLGRELEVLAESPGYMISVVCFREDVDEKDKKTIMEITSKMHESPKGQQILTLFRVDKIVYLEPGYFDSIEKLIDEYNELKGEKF